MKYLNRFQEIFKKSITNVVFTVENYFYGVFYKLNYVHNAIIVYQEVLLMESWSKLYMSNYLMKDSVFSAFSLNSSQFQSSSWSNCVENNCGGISIKLQFKMIKSNTDSSS